MAPLRLLLLACCCAAILSACVQLGWLVAEHELQARVGPCAEAMRAVRQELGAPTDVVHGDEVVTGRPRAFVHRWSYPEGADTALVFRWEDGGVGCGVAREGAGDRRGGAGNDRPSAPR